MWGHSACGQAEGPPCRDTNNENNANSYHLLSTCVPSSITKCFTCLDSFNPYHNTRGTNDLFVLLYR